MARKRSEQLRQQILRVREDERKAVARELHDQIIQSLIGMNYHLSEVNKHISEELSLPITRLQSDLHQIIDELRRICANLRPPVLDSIGLSAAIRSCMRELERQDQYRIVYHVQEDSDQPVPEPIAISIYRVLQELLANVQKHARASEIVVRLHLSETILILIVQDNGRGFMLPTPLDRLLDTQHFGLVGIREQIESINGTFHIETAPGKGTRIQVTVALPIRLECHQREMREVYAEQY